MARGVRILASPGRFVAYVTDLIDPESREARVLYNSCDARYLSYFADTLEQRTPEAIQAASARATDYLHGERLVDESAARDTSEQIAAGLAHALGIAYPSAPEPTHLPPISDPPAPRRQDTARGAQYTTQGDVPAAMAARTPAEAPTRTVSAPPRRAATGQASVPASPSAPANAKPSQTTTAPQKGGSSWAVGCLLTIVAFIVFVAMASYCTSGISTTNTVASATPIEEGTIDGVSYRMEECEVTDRNGDSETQPVLFVHNDTDETIRVMSRKKPGSYVSYDVIPALAPGDDGILMMPGWYEVEEYLRVVEIDGRSCSEFLSWKEESRDDMHANLTVYNSSEESYAYETRYLVYDNDILLYEVLLYEVERAIGTPQETIGQYLGQFDVLNYDYDLYLNGVLIPRAE